jgi:ferredoxin--NADP+ reductase
MATEEVLSVEHFSDKLFRFTTTKPEDLSFKAGQFTVLELPDRGDDVARPYSICSAPDQPFLEFYSIKVPGGAFTEDLQQIVPGDEIEISIRPAGTLTINSLKPGRTLWLMATGTGIAPFISIFRDPTTNEMFDDVRVVWSTRTVQEQVYADELQGLGVKYYPVITGNGDPRITDAFRNKKLYVVTEFDLDPENDRVMLCGNETFNKEMRSMLKEGGWSLGSRRELGTFLYEKAFVG